MMIFTHILGLSWIALSAVYRCDLPGEPVMFSDRPCQDAVVIELKGPPQMHSIALKDADLETILGATNGSAAGRSQRRTQRHAKPGVSRSQACEEARAKLRSVQMRRRKGYSLAEGVQLEGQAEKFRDTIRTMC